MLFIFGQICYLWLDLLSLVVQEIKQLKDQLKTQQSSIAVEVQCRLADTMLEMVMEITALRTKVAEMKDESSRQEKILRVKICEEYNSLVHSLVSSITDLKRKFDEFR